MKFIYGSFKFEYELILHDRKTISLTVLPNLKIIVKAPNNSSEEKINIFLKKKWLWIKKQISFFNNHNYKKYKFEYISGEELLYLGKQYKLIIKRSEKNSIKLINNNFIVYSKVNSGLNRYIKAIIKNWYKGQILSIFKNRLIENIKLFPEYEMPLLSIREMDKRWGSYTGTNQIILNPNLIHTSIDCVDYVIVHELCHMKYKNHSKLFYRLLDAKNPRWRKIKEKLENYNIRPF